MKHMKKAISLLLALVMALALATTAGAATQQTVTNNTSHNYAAYQVFSGTQAANEATLADVQWGSGVNGADLLAALKAADADTVFTVNGTNIFASCNTAANVAAVLGDYNDDSDVAMAFARVAYANKTNISTSIPANATNVTLDSGYYLIVDTASGTNMTKNLALLQVTNKGNIEIADKTGEPTVAKYVREVESKDANDLTKGTWGKTADASMNDEVWFRLVATLPDNYDNFTTYRLYFMDTLADGLVNGDSFSVVSSELNVYLVDKDTGSVTATYGAGNALPTGWTLIGGVDMANSDLRAVLLTNESPYQFKVDIANLKAIAAAAETGDKIVVEYCAKLNEGAIVGRVGNPNKVQLVYSNDPNYVGNVDSAPTAWTAEDVVRVFTYELDVTKIDGSNMSTKLAGAKFLLKNGNNDYATVDANNKVTGWNITGTELTTDANGQIKITGLDDGTYYLCETAAPAGYNTLTDPITVVISSTLDDGKAANTNGDALSALTITVGDNGTAENGDVTTGIVTMNVENFKGATLPETGGIGTTMFYVIGGVLVAGAAVVLITRKRVRDEQ